MNYLKLQYLYLLNSGLSLIFALGLLFMTPTLLSLFGLNENAATRLLAQFIGAGLIVSGLVTLLAREVTDLQARAAINYAHLIAGVLAMVITLNAILTGVMSGAGYLPVAVFVILAIGFAYFQFFRPME
ncbi:MAG: hypothetical protein QY332_04790 [Anaerolineales bacterium]|nr:MAG: hypothetical protein QY332_04790 [Anaerolineales bacterium]